MNNTKKNLHYPLATPARLSGPRYTETTIKWYRLVTLIYLNLILAPEFILWFSASGYHIGSARSHRDAPFILSLSFD